MTEPNTRALQDSNCRGKVITTGRGMLNTKDWFIAKERTRQLDEIQHLEAKKKVAKSAEALRSKAVGLIENFASKGKDVKNEEDAKSLPVSTLKILCQWKQQKKIPIKKDKLLYTWMKVKNNPTPPSASWTDAEEALLQRLKEDYITIIETAYGRERVREIEEPSTALPSKFDCRRESCLQYAS